MKNVLRINIFLQMPRFAVVSIVIINFFYVQATGSNYEEYSPIDPVSNQYSSQRLRKKLLCLKLHQRFFHWISLEYDILLIETNWSIIKYKFSYFVGHVIIRATKRRWFPILGRPWWRRRHNFSINQWGKHQTHSALDIFLVRVMFVLLLNHW